MEDLFNCEEIKLDEYLGVSLILSLLIVYPILLLFVGFSSAAFNVVLFIFYMLITISQLKNDYTGRIRKTWKYLIIDIIPFVFLLLVVLLSLNSTYLIIISLVLSFIIGYSLLFFVQNGVCLKSKTNISNILKRYTLFKRRTVSPGKEYVLEQDRLTKIFIIVLFLIYVGFASGNHTVICPLILSVILIFVLPMIYSKMIFRSFEDKSNVLKYLIEQIKDTQNIKQLSIYLHLLKKNIVCYAFPLTFFYFRKRWMYHERNILINKSFNRFKQLAYNVRIFGNENDNVWFRKELTKLETAIKSNNFSRETFNIYRRYEKRDICKIAEMYSVNEYQEFEKIEEILLLPFKIGSGILKYILRKHPIIIVVIVLYLAYLIYPFIPIEYQESIIIVRDNANETLSNVSEVVKSFNWLK